MRSIIVVILTFFLMSCEEFQTESFSASDIDAKAVNALADSVFISTSTEQLSAFKATWKNKSLDTIRVALNDSLLSNGVILTVLDTAYSIKIPANNDTSYAAFTGGTSEAVLFVGEFIDVLLVDGNGSTTPPDDTSMELPAIYESLNGLASTDHYVKARYVFKEVPQNSIFQFIQTEQTKTTTFNLIINQ